MKRIIFLLLALVIIGVAVPAHATSLNFQNPTDNGSVNIAMYGGGAAAMSSQWTESTNGLNNYLTIGSTKGGAGEGYTTFFLVSPLATTYAAATYLGYSGASANPGFVLYDSSLNVLYAAHEDTQASGTHRYEVKMSGGTAYIYKDGTILKTSGVLAQNPSYIGFGTEQNGLVGETYYTFWDDYTYSQTENKYIFGLPESDNNAFVILQDIANGANDGLYNSTSGIQANANFMQGQWSRGNSAIPPDALTNESIQLVHYGDGVVYATNYTGLNYAGTITIDIKSLLLDTNAPDGYYALTIPGTGAYSNFILKKSNGATVQFNADTYSTGDTATIIYYVLGGGYWATGTRSYKMSIYSLTEGFIQNTTITIQSGSITHSWSESNTPGAYYALLYATDLVTGQESLLGLDWATLSSYLNFAGYVNNAQTGVVISGAHVNITQDGTIINVTTVTDGNYSAPGFSTGASLTVNATATGFRQYNYTFIPMVAKGVTMNISLVPVTPTFTGLAIGGVDRDDTYGRPIEGATVTVRNTSTGEYYTKTTSMTGWYLCDFGSTCNLATKTPYNVWAYKVGYLNSTTESVVTT